MKKEQIKGSLLLFLAAIIWGVAFVAQSVGMDYVGPFTFNCVRTLIGGLVLIPCIAFLNRGKVKKKTDFTEKKRLLLGGICCGVALTTGSTLQQFGIMYTTVGKAGFITAFYIVLVPVLGIFFKKKTGWKIWTAVAIALVGLYFLCITESFHVGKGDVYIFLCALLFSLHILTIDYFAPRTDGVKMSCIQFFVAGILSIPPMLLTETTTISAVRASMGPILYAGVLSCGVAYTLQIIGQKNMNPAVASLILSLESCISVLAGWAVLGEQLSARESLGCVLMFAAIILAQLPDKKEESYCENTQ